MTEGGSSSNCCPLRREPRVGPGYWKLKTCWLGTHWLWSQAWLVSVTCLELKSALNLDLTQVLVTQDVCVGLSVHVLSGCLVGALRTLDVMRTVGGSVVQHTSSLTPSLALFEGSYERSQRWHCSALAVWGRTVAGSAAVGAASAWAAGPPKRPTAADRTATEATTVGVFIALPPKIGDSNGHATYGDCRYTSSYWWRRHFVSWGGRSPQVAAYQSFPVPVA
jgi:hypothetical protein